MRILGTTLAAAAFMALFMATPAAAETRRVNNVSGISAVDASGRFKVEIVQGVQAGATLSGPASDLDQVGVRYSDGRLKLWEKCTVFCGRRDLDVVVRIVTPRLDAVAVSKGAEATATDIVAGALALNVVMGGALKISGRCDALDADVRMGGALSAEDLSCRSVTAKASMGGVADVRASDAARAQASMGGAITLHGAPPHVDSSGSMGGTVSTVD